MPVFPFACVAMKRTLSTNEAVALLLRDENASWSTYAAEALVEWILEYEDATGTETEFCPIAIRCEWAEYATLHEIAEAYFSPSVFKDWQNMSAEDQREDVIFLLDRKTNWIKLPENAGYLVQSF